MYDYSGSSSALGTATADRSSVMGRVLTLLGFAFLFTAGGAVVAPAIGPAAFLISLVGSIGTLIALFFLKERAPLNLMLLYAFATFEGLALGLILEMYIARGLGSIVMSAAGATGAITLAAGAYGATTKRDLSGLGNILMLGLFAVIIASLIGFFLHIPLMGVVIAAISAVIFTGFLVFDLNRVANARGATEGTVILLAVSVYLDIFNLFLDLLRLLSFFSGNDD